jgi:hypothetical protein
MRHRGFSNAARTPSEKPTYMRLELRSPQPTRSNRWLLPVAMVVLGLTWGEHVSAASLSEAQGREAQPSRHHCQCGVACQGISCCCVSDEETPSSSAQSSSHPLPRPMAPDMSPCLNAAPCDGSEPPTASTVESVGQFALFAGCECYNPTSAASFLQPLSSHLHPARLAFCLDHPPERSASA